MNNRVDSATFAAPNRGGRVTLSGGALGERSKPRRRRAVRPDGPARAERQPHLRRRMPFITSSLRSR